jgi:hypothetical protein
VQFAFGYHVKARAMFEQDTNVQLDPALVIMLEMLLIAASNAKAKKVIRFSNPRNIFNAS